MITAIYIGICILVLVCTVYNMIFKEEKIADQVNAAMIIIPLVLRILMIK